ncbi:MAG: VTT domain-containing protein [Candidatus Poribacteria bacterium]
MIEENTLKKLGFIARFNNLSNIAGYISSQGKWFLYISVALAFCFGELLLLLLPEYRSLSWFCLYSAISNTCVSVFPHEPSILFYGGIYDPLLVAILGAFSVCWIEFYNYRILSFVTSIRKVQVFTSKNMYQKAERWFSKMPFFSIFIACLTPIPYAPFRFFAVNSRYSMNKLILAVFMGRLPRYYILALTGDLIAEFISLPSWIYGVFFILLLGFAIWKRIQSKIKKIIGKEE